MKKLPIDKVAFERPLASPLVEATLGLLREKVRDAYNASDQDWNEFAMAGNETLVTAETMQEVERCILDSGHRFEWSAAISADERPEAYKPKGEDADDTMDFMFSHPDAPSDDPDDQGRSLCGVGDNVVRHNQDVIGIARYIRSNDKVLSLLSDGVPAGTIAIIDDSGGTLTAPIIDQFSGVICAGGTVRSHLGILTREYNIPCLMNAKVAGIRDGDTVSIETSAPAKTAEDYQQNVERHARVWRLPGK